MKKTLQRLSIVTVGLSLCLWSCKEQTQVQPQNDDLILRQLSRNDSYMRMEEVAKALAKSMGNKEVRGFIKTEALKEFDNDYDILYDWIDNKTIEGKSFESILVSNTITKPSAKTNALEDLRATAKVIPLLNISVPVNIDKWQTENYEPLVAVSPYAFVKDDKSVNQLKAYDSQGNVHWLDALKQPDVPVVVIGLNERTILKNGKVELKPIFSSDKASGKFIDDSNRPIPFVSTKGQKSSKVAQWYPYSGEEGNDKIYLNGVADGGGWTNYEGWGAGDPEIQVFVFVKNTSGQVYNAGQSYHDINDDYNWHYTTLDHLFGTYDVDLYNEVYFGIWEDDGYGDDNKINVSNGVEYGVSYSDDFVGSRWVDRRWYPDWYWSGVGYGHQFNSASWCFVKISAYTGRTDK